MSAVTSPTAGRNYGVQRVCAVWAFPRASFYALDAARPATAAPGKRGPKTTLDDIALLALIRADLAQSPFRGEGHRKVFGRLRYVTDYFQGQSRFHGFTPSFAFVGEPETNGVVERFNRTLKEQIIHGHTYRNRGELAAAVASFVELYNREWRLEKLGYKSPLEARRDFQPATLLAALLTFILCPDNRCRHNLLSNDPWTASRVMEHKR